jgi:hypothetical protein
MQLIEFGIVAIGLISGYKFFENTIAVFFQFAYLYADEGMEKLRMLLPALIMLLIYGTGFYFLIKKNGQLASWLQWDGPNDIISIKTDARSLLHVILLGIIMFTLISNAPKVLFYLLESIKNEVSHKILFTETTTIISKSDFWLSLAEVVIALPVTLFARTISSWFIRTNPVDELTFQSIVETK